MKLPLPALLPLLVASLVLGCGAHSGDMRPDRNLPAEYGVECDAKDYDRAPRLRSGRTPVFPASMLSPSYIDERRIRHLPLSWDVVTRFIVAADGTTAQVHSDATDPAFLATHSNAAISAWRFEPARRNGEAVAARCEHRMVFKLVR